MLFRSKEAGLLTSGRTLDLPAPVGPYRLFRLMREDLQQFVEDTGIRDAQVFGNNWGLWVSLATVLIRLAGWFHTERQLTRSARLIMQGRFNLIYLIILVGTFRANKNESHFHI